MDERLFPVDSVKRCCSCGAIKPMTEFNRRSKAKDGRQSSCRACNQAYHFRNWDRHMAQIRARTKRRQEATKAFVLEYLRDHPCVDCGETDLVVLEFDHLRDNVSRLVATAELWRVVEEIAKCEVVCANCHRRRTARRGNWYRQRSE